MVLRVGDQLDSSAALNVAAGVVPYNISFFFCRREVARMSA
jgi:hypothetical protein